MNNRDREYLKKALKNYHRSMEESLGKAIRAEEGGEDGYIRYLRIIGEIREYAREHKISVKQAAKELSKGFETLAAKDF